MAAVQHKNCIRRRTKRAKHFKALQDGEWGRGDEPELTGKGHEKWIQVLAKERKKKCRELLEVRREGRVGREVRECARLLPPDVDSFACALGEPLQQTHTNKQTDTQTQAPAETEK